MGSHPLNLALRFLLELAALIAIGFWGWEQYDTWMRFILAIGLPLIAAAIWGIFNVPNDPSRSGNAPIPVPGIIRLLLEFAFFTFASWTLYSSGEIKLAWILVGIVAIHYVISFDRIAWLVKQ